MERMSPVRTKQMRLVVTFYTTAGAIAAEQLCRKAGLEGRLISVPRCLTSDCGIAWSAPPETRAVLEQNPLPEVAYFMAHFIPAFELTLDELGTIEE